MGRGLASCRNLARLAVGIKLGDGVDHGSQVPLNAALATQEPRFAVVLLVFKQLIVADLRGSRSHRLRGAEAETRWVDGVIRNAIEGAGDSLEYSVTQKTGLAKPISG